MRPHQLLAILPLAACGAGRCDPWFQLSLVADGTVLDLSRTPGVGNEPPLLDAAVTFSDTGGEVDTVAAPVAMTQSAPLTYAPAVATNYRSSRGCLTGADLTFTLTPGADWDLSTWTDPGPLTVESVPPGEPIHLWEGLSLTVQWGKFIYD